MNFKMKFTINFEKKHLYVLSFLVAVFGIFTVFAAQPFDPVYGWHPLQQITVDESGSTSVDANSNGIIDNAELAQNATNANTLNGLTVSQLTTQIINQVVTSGALSPWMVSGNNLYYNLGKVGIGTSSPRASLEVNGDVYANNFVDANNPSYSVNPAGTTKLNSLYVSGKQIKPLAGSLAYETGFKHNLDLTVNPNQYICGISFKSDCDSYSSDDGCIDVKVCNLG